jgi:hypothetical protein
MIHDLQIIIAFLMFVLAYIKYPDLVKVDRKFVILFGAIITAINFAKTAVAAWALPKYFPDAWAKTIQVFDMIPANHLLAAWWEDCFYVLPFMIISLYLEKMNESKRKKIAKATFYTVFSLFIAHFTLGHLYQGWVGLTVFVYPIISYNVGKKHGLGSMMMLHVLFDFTMYMAFWLAFQLMGI